MTNELLTRESINIANIAPNVIMKVNAGIGVKDKHILTTSPCFVWVLWLLVARNSFKKRPELSLGKTIGYILIIHLRTFAHYKKKQIQVYFLPTF